MELAQLVDGFVHKPTQTDGPGVDLTVSAVARVTTPGRVDFGGSELDPADRETIDPEYRNLDDEYGWWHLEGGSYLMDYNESVAVPADRTLFVQTRDEIRISGAHHPTTVLASDRPIDGMPLVVPAAGLRLKENARVSTLYSAAPRSG